VPQHSFDNNPSGGVQISRQPAGHEQERRKQLPSMGGHVATARTPAAGGCSCQRVHASMLQRSAPYTSSRTDSVLALQRKYGNRYVQRVVSVLRQASDVEPSHDVENAIYRERGGGHGLDSNVRQKMESSFGADFRDVRVHNDANAHALSRSLSARAFAFGRDIYFSEGAYQPGTSAGRHLLAHELTHVVQQGGAAASPQTKLSVSNPGDAFEQEADRVAAHVMRQETHSEAGNELLLRQPEKPRTDEDERRKTHGHR